MSRSTVTTFVCDCCKTTSATKMHERALMFLNPARGRTASLCLSYTGEMVDLCSACLEALDGAVDEEVRAIREDGHDAQPAKRAPLDGVESDTEAQDIVLAILTELRKNPVFESTFMSLRRDVKDAMIDSCSAIVGMHLDRVCFGKAGE